MPTVISAGRPSIVVARPVGPKGDPGTDGAPGPIGPTGPAGPQGTPGQDLDPDASGTLAQRAAYDAQPQGFTYLQTDVTPWQYWVKASNASGAWAGPQPFGSIVQTFETRASVVAAFINPVANFLRTAGYGAIGDGGGALYKRVGSSPAHNGKVQSADGAWWELAETSPDVRMFGAKFDDATDDLTAWNNAIGWANIKGGQCSIRATGGTSVISGAVTPIAAPDFWIVGDHAAGVRCTGTGITFQWGSSTYGTEGGGIDGLDFLFTGTPAATQTCIKVYWGFRVIFSNITVQGIATLISLGETAAFYAAQVQLFDINGSCANVAAPFIDWKIGNGVYISRVDVFVSDAAGGVVSRSFLRVAPTVAGGVDTAQIEFVTGQLFWAGLLLAAGDGVVIQNMSIVNCYFDGISGTGCYLIVSHPTGLIINIRGDNCWFTGGAGGTSVGDYNIMLTNQGNPTNGAIQDITFVNSIFMIAKRENIYVSANCRRISFGNCRGVAPNGLAVGHSSVRIEAGALDTQFIGGYYNHDIAAFGYPQRGAYAFQLDANLDRYSITALDAGGTAGSLSVGSNSAGSKRRKISLNNPDYAVAATGGIFVLPANGGTFTNTTPFTVEAFIYGGTISAIYRDSIAIAAGPQASVRVDPGDHYAINYTVAPTVKYFIVR